MSNRVIYASLYAGWNMSYAIMRAQGKEDMAHYQIPVFLLGFPATLVTWICVTKGSEKAYGMDFPRKQKN